MATINGTAGNDNLTGTSGNDTLQGFDGNDSVVGGAGNDFVRGNNGTDWLEGGAGNDNLGGGSGQDSFVFREAGTANADVFNDFASDWDNIQLDAAFFTALGSGGQFSAGDVRFWSSTSGTAHDADDRIIYNTSTRQLFYDADGNGSGAAQLIGTLNAAATVAATDIRVFGTAGSGHIVGTSGNDSLVGTSGNDWLEGLAGNDTLDGAQGWDTLDGGTGNDTYLVGDESFVDVILDAGGVDTVIGERFGTMDDGIENLTLQGTWDTLTDWPDVAGNALNNVITNDTAQFAMLDGGDGNDTLIGGSGADRFFFYAGSTHGNDSIDGRGGHDALDFQFAQGMVVIDFQAGTVTGGGTGGSGSATFVSVEEAIGSPFNDRLIAHDGGIELMGYLGNDTVIGGAGNDTLWGEGYWNDHGADGPGGDDQVFGGTGDDWLIDEGGDDLLDGGAGNDHFSIDQGELDDLHGNDTVIGGDGNDTLESSRGVDFADLEAGILRSGDAVVTLSGIENLLTYFGTTDGRILGSAGSNVLGGGWGRDTIEARAGDDTVYGDTDGYDGLVSPDTYSDRLLGEDGNDLLIGQFGSDTLEGGAGNDTLNGGAPGFDSSPDRDDLLDGGAGNDSLIGSAGADSFTFTVAPGVSNADRITNFSGEDQIVLDGTAHANSGPSGAFSANDARFWSSIDGVAHDADDRVIYNTSSGELWYDANGSGAGAVQLIATLQGAPTLTATDITIINGSGGGGSTINGTTGSDSLVGTGANDTINGFAGMDTIDGGAGADSMVGGDDPDVYFVDNPGDVIVEFENGGFDEVRSTISYALTDWVNNLTLVGGAAFNAVGNELPNLLTGNALNNVLTGGAGIDTLVGGDGNDTLDGWSGLHSDSPDRDADVLDGGLGNDEYRVDSVNDALSDAGGVDFVVALDTSYTLGAGFENLEIHNDVSELSSYIGIGNELNNRIVATFAGARLEGRAGNDTLIGGEGQGNSQLFGGDGNDSLVGGRAGDRVDGGAGNDVLNGAPDFLGTDDHPSLTYVFSVAPGLANADRIVHFMSIDNIELDGVAHTSIGASGRLAAGDVRFWSSGTGTAHDADDRVIYNTSSGELWYDADGSGAGARQLIATLEGAPGLVATNITVVNGSAGGGGGGSTINGTANAEALAGTAGNDTINGLGGNDTISASAGSDVIDGGAGTDSIEYRTATSGIVANFGTASITGGFTGASVSFSNVEKVLGSNFNDQLTGNSAAQNLTGQGGNDTIAGAGGVDTLWGGGGNDFFVFREMGTANADRVSDFASGADKLQLDDSAFTAIGALGNFAAGDARFWAAAGATSGHDANDRVVYNLSTGNLYYDADGSGSGAAQLVATILNHPAVAATDITVI